MGDRAECLLPTHSQAAARGEDSLEVIYLHPGHVQVSAAPVILKMLLGSCVGLFLFDPVLGVGGATHFMLPTWRGEGRPSERYGDVAIAQLFSKLKSLGSETKNVKAKMYGGACVLNAFSRTNGGHIGQKNVDLCNEILRRESIEIVDQNVLGKSGRRVSMVSHTGKIVHEFVGTQNGTR